jgi:hypothetical protein
MEEGELTAADKEALRRKIEKVFKTSAGGEMALSLAAEED